MNPSGSERKRTREEPAGFVGDADDGDAAVGVGGHGDVVAIAPRVADVQLQAPVDVIENLAAVAHPEIAGEFLWAVERICEVGELSLHHGIVVRDLGRAGVELVGCDDFFFQALAGEERRADGDLVLPTDGRADAHRFQNGMLEVAEIVGRSEVGAPFPLFGRDGAIAGERGGEGVADIAAEARAGGLALGKRGSLVDAEEI